MHVIYMNSYITHNTCNIHHSSLPNICNTHHLYLRNIYKYVQCTPHICNTHHSTNTYTVRHASAIHTTHIYETSKHIHIQLHIMYATHMSKMHAIFMDSHIPTPTHRQRRYFPSNRLSATTEHVLSSLGCAWSRLFSQGLCFEVHCVNVYVLIYRRVEICMYTCMYVCLCIYICVYVYMDVYMYTYISIHFYVYIYMYTFLFKCT